MLRRIGTIKDTSIVRRWMFLIPGMFLKAKESRLIGTAQPSTFALARLY